METTMLFVDQAFQVFFDAFQDDVCGTQDFFGILTIICFLHSVVKTGFPNYGEVLLLPL